MVRYYGRARQRTGSVNTNQLGLKMSGCVSKVGRSAFCRVSLSHRVKCNQKRCGNVVVNGVVLRSNMQPCVAPQPRSRAVAGGVGSIWSPRI